MHALRPTLLALSLCMLNMPAALAYCQPRGNSLDAWIDRLDVNDRPLTSGNNWGYYQHTKSAPLFAQGNALLLTPGFKASATDLYWRAWVDFNRDGGFSDSEIIFSGRSAGPITARFDLPANLPSGGPTRLRVGMGRTAYPEPCAVTSQGRTLLGDFEDFTVSLPGEPDTQAPQPVAYQPGATQRFVPVESELSIRFDEPLAETSIGSDALVLREEGSQEAVPGNLRFDAAERTLRFKPQQPLRHGGRYSAVISSDLADLSGIPLGKELSWPFAAAPDPQQNPLAMTWTFPGNEALEVDLRSDVAINFSRDIDPATLSNDNIQLLDGDRPIPLKFQYDNWTRQARFAPLSGNPLDFAKRYRVVIGRGVQDRNGYSLPQETVWSFNTIRYCTSTGLGSPYSAWIKRVEIGMDTFSNANTYSTGYYYDAAYRSTDLGWSGTLVRLRPGTPQDNRPERQRPNVVWKAWIDWNQDNIFSESEAVLSAVSNVLVQFNVPTPPDAKPGETRMRVAVKGGFGNPPYPTVYPGPCDRHSEGEVRDFKVRLSR
ncbi:Ig-like domain-containing protein [Chitinimonas lacunae]|uniref:Ig-like domain-containing protein n=1 Tax=Chitinimonas lacunae TaxID=1963018 RepID=A0ABV8MM25_9NEIS